MIVYITKDNQRWCWTLAVHIKRMKLDLFLTSYTENGRGYEQTILPRRKADGWQAHEKLLNIINCQGNAKQKKIPFKPTRTTIIKKQITGFPGSSVVKTFNEASMGSIPGLGTRIPDAVWHGQKIKFKKKNKKPHTIF